MKLIFIFRGRGVKSETDSYFRFKTLLSLKNILKRLFKKNTLKLFYKKYFILKMFTIFAEQNIKPSMKYKNTYSK